MTEHQHLALALLATQQDKQLNPLKGLFSEAWPLLNIISKHGAHKPSYPCLRTFKGVISILESGLALRFALTDRILYK